jgi:hypothetical protein
MRIQSIVLENHRDISVLGLNIVHELAVDPELTGADIFQAGDHTKCSGFTTARRTYEDDKLLIFDFHIEILNSVEAVGINLVDILQR